MRGPEGLGTLGVGYVVGDFEPPFNAGEAVFKAVDLATVFDQIAVGGSEIALHRSDADFDVAYIQLKATASISK